MRRSMTLVLAAGSAFLLMGLGPIDSAESQADTARTLSRSAMNRLESLNSAISDSAGDLGSLRRLIDEERQQRIRLTRYIDVAIAQAQAGIAGAEKDAATRRADADKAGAALDAAHDTLSQRILGIDETVLNERKAFERSEPFVSSAGQVESRTLRLGEVAAQMESEIAANPAVLKAQKEVDEAQRVVKQLRVEPARESAVAEASQAWIEATNRLNKARRTLLESNQSYAQATADLREAQRGVTVLKAQFETSLPDRPAVVAARDARDAAEQALRLAEVRETVSRASLQRSLEALAQVRTDVEALSAIKRDPDAGLRKIEASLGGVRSDLEGAASKASSARSDLSGSLNALDSIDGHLRSAASQIADLERDLAEAKRNKK